MPRDSGGTSRRPTGVPGERGGRARRKIPRPRTNTSQRNDVHVTGMLERGGPMAKDTSVAMSPASSGGTVKTEVAVIGIVLSFLAGAAVTWGSNQRSLHAGDITADGAGAPAGGENDCESQVP